MTVTVDRVAATTINAGSVVILLVSSGLTNMMPCPKCSGGTRVADSRLSDSVKGLPIVNIRRRRKCRLCGYKYTTREVPEQLEDE